MYTAESLLLENTSGLYLASLTHLVPLPPSIPSSLSLHEKLCGGFREERVTHVWTATHASQPVIAKIFDPLYFIDPYDGTDPFPLLDLSVSRVAEAYRQLAPLHGTKVLRCLGLLVSPLPSQGNCTVYVLLLEHVAGQDVRYLIPAPTSTSLCPAHRASIVDAAVNVFYVILMCGGKQRDMEPRNLIIRSPKRSGGAPFCVKYDCPVHLQLIPIMWRAS